MNSIYTRESQSSLNHSFPELSTKIQSLGADLQSKIVALQASIESSAEKSVCHLCPDLSKYSTNYEAQNCCDVCPKRGAPRISQ